MYSFKISTFTDGHLGWFCIFPIVNNAEMNPEMQISLHYLILLFYHQIGFPCSKHLQSQKIGYIHFCLVSFTQIMSVKSMHGTYVALIQSFFLYSINFYEYSHAPLSLLLLKGNFFSNFWCYGKWWAVLFPVL